MNAKTKTKSKRFPNGFASWQETHFEVVQGIVTEFLKDEPKGVVKEYQESQGHTGLYQLAEQLTDEFEKKNKGREWDGEFYEEVWAFVDEKLKDADNT